MRRYLTKLHLSWQDDGSYLSDLPVVRALNEMGSLDLNHDVVFFIGENGAGKSTLLEAIAVCAGYNAEGGSRNFNFSTRDTVSSLHRQLRLTRAARERDGFFLRAESFYNLATQVEELEESGLGGSIYDSYGGRSLHDHSHGEGFLALIGNRFSGHGLYLLDEPESALSLQSQLALLRHMHRLVKAGSQFLIATHSPVLLSYPGAVIYEIGPNGIDRVPYDQCEPYVLTRQFLNQPNRFLHVLFDEEDE